MHSQGSVHGFTPVVKPEQKSQPVHQQRPLAARFKEVFALLLEEHKPLTVAAILGRTGYDVSQDSDLRNKLEQHEKVRVHSDGRYQYKPKYGDQIYDMPSLLNFVRDSKQCITVNEVKDSYKTIEDDIRSLQKDGKMYIIPDPQGDDAMFPTEDLGIIVAEDVTGLYHETPVPRETLELQEAVVGSSLRSALANQPIKRAVTIVKQEKGKKKARQHKINIEKATNSHLAWLFQGAQPKNIDER